MYIYVCECIHARKGDKTDAHLLGMVTFGEGRIWAWQDLVEGWNGTYAFVQHTSDFWIFNNENEFMNYIIFNKN